MHEYVAHCSLTELTERLKVFPRPPVAFYFPIHTKLRILFLPG